MERGYDENQLAAVRIYTAVWLLLLFLLAATIFVARLELLARFSVLGSMAIASIKAGLVLAFFMHLKEEGRFLKWVLALTLLALMVLIGLTFVDVWYR